MPPPIPLAIRVAPDERWEKTLRRYRLAPHLVRRFTDRLLRKEAEFFRSKIIEGIKTGAPAGKKLEKLSPWTIATRKMAGLSGRKPLVERAQMMRAIKAYRLDPNSYMVGVLPGAVNKEGTSLLKIARIQEEGMPGRVIKISKRMAAFLAILMRHMRKTRRPKRLPGQSGYLFIKIPPRPFIRPVYDKFAKNERMVQARMRDRIEELAENLQWDWKSKGEK